MAQGIATRGDIVNNLVDGTPVNDMFHDFNESLATWNQHRSGLGALLCFETTASNAIVPQVNSTADFEEASEFGIAKSQRGLDTIRVGFTRKDYDSRTSYTRLFLRDAPADQVDALHNGVLEADNRLVFTRIMSALLRNAQRTNEEGFAVYPLFNGDGMVPPANMSGVRFDGTHQHYSTSGAAGIDSGDVEALMAQVEEHDYGTTGGSRLIVLMNQQQGRVARSWRAGVANANGQVASFDFIPSDIAPARITSEHVIGSTPSGDYEGLRIIGSYGDALISEDALMPAGYVLCFATGGANSTLNAVGFREHPNVAERGLKLVPGSSVDYPLNDATYIRTFGTGVRRRGAAAVMQITANASYATPVAYL